MSEFWPWIVIGAGIAFLFLRRYLSRPRFRYIRVHSPYREIEERPSLETRIRVGIHAAMPALISAVVLASALFIILHDGYSDAQQKWAFGAVGTILGYWFKA